MEFKQTTYGIVIFILILSGISCTSISSPGDNVKTLPPLTDTIPYQKLGSGILVFERLGLSPEPFHGFYFVNLETEEKWAFGFSGGITPQIRDDAGAIVFSLLDDPVSRYNIYVSDLFGGVILRMSDLTGSERFPVWGSQGTYLYYWSYFSSPPILYEQLASASVIERFPLFQAGVLVNNQFQALFPTGKVDINSNNDIVFATNIAPADSLKGIYLVKLGESNFVHLFVPDSGKMIESPVFTPDEKGILFVEIDRDTLFTYHSMSIRVIDLDTRTLKTLWTTALNARDEWRFDGKDNSIFLHISPDGNWILFNKPEGDLISHIYGLRIDGSEIIQITQADSIADYSVSMGKIISQK